MVAAQIGVVSYSHQSFYVFIKGKLRDDGLNASK